MVGSLSADGKTVSGGSHPLLQKSRAFSLSGKMLYVSFALSQGAPSTLITELQQ